MGSLFNFEFYPGQEHECHVGSVLCRGGGGGRRRRRRSRRYGRSCIPLVSSPVTQSSFCLCVAHVVPSCCLFPEYEESGLLETDEVGGAGGAQACRSLRDLMSVVFSPPPHANSPLSRRPWTPVKWWKLKPEPTLEMRTSFFRLERTTCTSHMINTTRPLDSGCLDTMKYVPAKMALCKTPLYQKTESAWKFCMFYRRRVTH